MGPILRREDLSRDEVIKIKSNLCAIIDLKIPKKDFEQVSLEDKLKLEIKTKKAEKELDELINEFIELGDRQAAGYLMNAKSSMFNDIKS